MNKRNEKKLTRREIALQNLEKANEAKKQKIAQPKGPDNWETRSQTRLERIMEKAEKALAKANNMDGADISKLANTLKICHQAHRTLQAGREDNVPQIRTRAEGQEYLQKIVNGLVSQITRMPPITKRMMVEKMVKPVAEAAGVTIAENSHENTR